MSYYNAVEFPLAQSVDGSYEATWGQQAQLTSNSIASPGHVAYINCLCRFGENPLTIEAAVDRIKTAVELNDSLRINVENSAGTYTQRIAPLKSFCVQLRDLPSDEEPVAFYHRQGFYPFLMPLQHLRTGQTVNVDLMIREGSVYMIAFSLPHAFLDLRGSDALMRIVEDARPTTSSSVERSIRERTEFFTRRSVNSLARWEGALRHSEVFDPHRSADRGANKILYCHRSVSADIAVLSDRCRVTSASVVLGVYAMCLAASLGLNELLPLQVLCHNRLPIDRNYIGSLVQPTAMVISLSAASIAELTKSVHRQAIGAYASSAYDPMPIRQMEIQLGYPECSAIPHFFNYNTIEKVVSSRVEPDFGITDMDLDRDSYSDSYLDVANDGHTTIFQLRAVQSIIPLPIAKAILIAIPMVLRSAVENGLLSAELAAGNLEKALIRGESEGTPFIPNVSAVPFTGNIGDL